MDGREFNPQILVKFLSMILFWQLEEYSTSPLVFGPNRLLAKHLLSTLKSENPQFPMVCREVTNSVTGATQQLYLVGDPDKFDGKL